MCLASCAGGGQSDPPVTTDSDTASPPDETGDPGFIRVDSGAEEAKRYADSLLASLDDHAFTKEVFSVAVTPGVQIAPEDPVDGFEDALIARNASVTGRYGITVAQIETPIDLMLSDSYSAYLSGTFYADAMIIPQSAVGEFASKGFLMNAGSLPHIDYSKEYFDRRAMDQASAGYTSPVIAGAATKDIGSYYCLYVNTKAIGKQEADDLSALVRSGGWTWDALLGITRGYASVDGGLYAVGAASDGILVDTVYYSTGQNYLDAGPAKIPTVAFETDLTLKAIEILKSLGGTGTVFDSGEESELDLFRNGNVLFHADTVSNMEAISHMGADWLPLPIPKTDAAADSYYSYCSSDAPVMVIPSGASDADDTAFAVEALNAASCGYLDRCYYDKLIRTSVNNSRSLDMLDYICGIKGGVGVYDFTRMYASVFPMLKDDTTGTVGELAEKGGDLATSAYKSRYDLNWRFVHVFPMTDD